MLVNGGTDAIGSAAIQLIRALNIPVTAVCGGKHLTKMSSLGAENAIDYQTTDFTQLPLEFEMVFEAVGKSTFGKCRRILKEKGIYASTELGPWAQNPILALLPVLTGNRKVLFPIPKNSKADAEYIAQLMADGKFAPLIDRTFPLTEVTEAFRYVERGEKIGNVLIKIG